MKSKLRNDSFIVFTDFNSWEITVSLTVITGIADNPELKAWVESWYFSLSFVTDCSRNSISALVFKFYRRKKDFCYRKIACNM